MPSFFFKGDSGHSSNTKADPSQTLLFQAQQEFINHRYDKAVPILEKAANQGSIRAAMHLASMAMREEHRTVCADCQIAATWYIRALNLLTARAPNIPCTTESLELIEQVVELLMSHMLKDIGSKEGRALTNILWSMGKDLKPRAAIKLGPSDVARMTESDQIQVCYARAMCITIYNCRGFIYQAERNNEKAKHYYTKCVNVPATDIHSCDVAQKSAESSLGYLDRDSVTSCSPLLAPSSPTSSIHSAHNCSGCGVEKAMMPVCSRCKVRRYCSNKCRLDHAAEHEQECATLRESRS